MSVYISKVKEFRDLEAGDRIEVIFPESSNGEKVTGVVIERCYWNYEERSSLTVRMDNPGRTKMQFCQVYDKNYIRTISDGCSFKK